MKLGNKMYLEYEGERFKWGKIWHALFKYKWINLLILFIFWGLGLLYYKMQSPVYGASATIEIQNVQNARRDFFGNNIGESAGLETEIDIIRSNHLIEKTLKQLGNNVNYYSVDSTFKKKEFYKSAPYKVNNFIVYTPELYGKKITIRDLGGNKFSLIVQKTLKEKVLSFFKKNDTFKGLSKVFLFNKIYKTKDVAFKITKIKPFQNIKTYFSLYSDKQVLNRVKRNLKVAPASTDSAILKLDYKDSNEERTQDFLNTLIDNYLLFSVKKQTELDRKRLDFVNSQIATINSKLAQSENELEGYKIHNNISDIQAQIQEFITKEGEIKDRLEIEKVNNQSIVSLYKEVVNGNFSIISSLEDQYPVLATMAQNLDELYRQRERLLVNLTTNHPDVIAVNKNINSLKLSILNIVKGIKNQVSTRKKALEHDLALYQNMLKQFPNKEKELGRHERLFRVNDQVYNYLLQKQSELSIEKVSHTANKNVLDYAKFVKNLNLKLPFILALSTLLGLFMILLHTILRIKFDVRIKTPDDVKASTDMPLYGIIPFVEDKQSYNSAYVLNDATSTASEAFRAIRTNLDYVISPNGSKVILITSSIPNEGKTAVAANLASVIGMSEKKCVILSLDLRRPEMHHKFGLSNKVGMSDVLAGRAKLKEVIWEHGVYPNLNIITSGRIPLNPAELLSSSRMKEVIEELKKEYDYIILDTPPINYVADAVVLFKYADTNLFVVKSDFTEKKHMQELNDIIQKFGLKHAGIILNSVKKKYNQLEQFDYKYIYHEAL